MLLAVSGLLLAGGLRLSWVTPPLPTSAPVPSVPASAAPSVVALERHPRALVPTDIVSAPSLAGRATVLADREGAVWVFGSGMLRRLDPAPRTWRGWTASDDAAFGASSMAGVAAGGGIWLGTDDQLLWFDGTGFRDVIDGPPGMPTRGSVAEAPDGTLWIVTERGVFHWDGTSWTAAGAGRTSTAAGPIAVDHAGRVWVADYHYPGPVGDGISVYDGTSWRTYTAADAAPLSGRGNPDDATGTWVGNTPQAIVAAPDGSVWVATEGGLARFDGTSWRPSTAAETGFATAPGSLAVAPDGTVWVTGYACEGSPVRVARFDGRAWTVFGPQDGLPAAEPGGCLGASVAATGGEVVVVVEGVVYRLAGERWERAWPATTILGPADPWSFVAVSRQELWATRDGLWHWRDGAWTSWRDDTGLPEVGAGFATLAMGPDGRAWLAGDIGVAVREGDHWTLVDDRPARTVAPAADGTVWVGGQDPGDVRTLRFDGSAWSARAAPDTPFGGVGSMTVDGDGTIWAAAMGGFVPDPGGCLARLVGERVGGRGAVRTQPVCNADVVASPDGSIWVTGEGQPPNSTEGWGLHGVAARFDGRTWTVYGEADGLPGVSARQPLAFTPDGAVWVTTWEGIARFDGTRWTMAVDDGRYYGPIAAAPDGSLWVAGPAGLEIVAGTGAGP